MNKEQTIKVLKVLWAVALIIGLTGLVMKFATGERLAGYGSYVPWGLWVAIYFHSVGIAGGVFAVGVAGYLLGTPGLRERLRVTMIVSVVSMLTGMFAIWLDLGQPFRFYRVMTAPAFTSMLTFNSWMYGLFMLAVAVGFLLSFRKAAPHEVNDRSGWLVPVLLFAAVLAVIFPSQSGAFFGVVDAKPYWNTALLPILFLTSATVSGASVLLLVHTFLLREDARAGEQPLKFLRPVILVGLIFYFVLEFAEFSVTYWSPGGHQHEAFNLVLFGPFWWVFWVVHLGGGLAALVLLLRGRSLRAVGTGAFLVALTFISTRLNILIPGQSVSELRGFKEAFTHRRLSYYYEATPNEYMVAAFLGAFGVGLAYAGIKLLSRFERTREARG